MKKADITNSINTIDDGGNNTAAEVRGVLGNLRDNSYGTVVTETYTSILNDNPNTTPNGTTHYYVLRFTKQGRTVTVNGTLTNSTTSIVSNQKWLDIDDGEYEHDANLCVFSGVKLSSSDSIRCKLVGSALTIIGAMGPLETIEVNFTYTTLN